MSSQRKQLAKAIKDYPYIVIIMRHADALAADGSGDFNRAISDKGKKQAKHVAKGLMHADLLPDTIVCSSATRARQTLAKMLKKFGDKPRVDYVQSLYDGGVDSIMSQLREARQSTRIMLIVGHEPVVSMASQWIANPSSGRSLQGMLGLGLSTGSIVVLGSKSPIASWGVRSADLLAVLRPKELED